MSHLEVAKKTDRISCWLLVLLGAAFMAQAAFYLPRMPERLASHFDIAGRPNGWLSRNEFAGLTAIMLIVLYLIFGLMPFVLPKLPQWMINLPRKDYWLAPERKMESLAYLRAWMRCFGCLTLLMLLVVFELVYRANLSLMPRLDASAIWIIGGYLALVIVFLVPGLGRFRVRRHR